MKYVGLILVLFLSACSTTPFVERKFPDVPKDLITECRNLQPITEKNPKFSDVLTSVTGNYSQYRVCQTKVDSWIKWYNDQKKIFESVK